MIWSEASFGGIRFTFPPYAGLPFKFWLKCVTINCCSWAQNNFTICFNLNYSLSFLKRAYPVVIAGTIVCLIPNIVFFDMFFNILSNMCLKLPSGHSLEPSRLISPIRKSFFFSSFKASIDFVPLAKRVLTISATCLFDSVEEFDGSLYAASISKTKGLLILHPVTKNKHMEIIIIMNLPNFFSFMLYPSTLELFKITINNDF